MSHCTNFDFQYTDRDLICSAFQALNLKWKDDVVYSYASQADKEAGIVETSWPAIIAEKNGFNYFMKNKGKYYILGIEKHDMSSYDRQIAKEMADEFRNTYIKEVAKIVVEDMNSQGQQAILEEAPGGYEIKFD
jgi:hypothetical protein